jgi:cell division cycle 2-like protein
MVMEYMEHDLRTYLDNLKEPLSLAEIKCVLQQILSGMAHMHERWVLHRDLKTTNLLINNQGRTCICDFGLARYRRARALCPLCLPAL